MRTSGFTDDVTHIVLVYTVYVELSYRTCGRDGQWLGRHAGDTSGGWTNYSDCYTPESKQIFHMLFKNISPQVSLMVLKL